MSPQNKWKGGLTTLIYNASCINGYKHTKLAHLIKKSETIVSQALEDWIIFVEVTVIHVKLLPTFVFITWRCWFRYICGSIIINLNGKVLWDSGKSSFLKSSFPKLSKCKKRVSRSEKRVWQTLRCVFSAVVVSFPRLSTQVITALHFLHVATRSSPCGIWKNFQKGVCPLTLRTWCLLLHFLYNTFIKKLKVFIRDF